VFCEKVMAGGVTPADLHVSEAKDFDGGLESGFR
jgi:hypothetical protein